MSMSVSSVNAITVDKRNRIWVSGYGGYGAFNIIDRKSEKIKIVHNTKIGGISQFHLDKEHPHDIMWLLINNNSQQVIKYDIKNEKIIKIYNFIKGGILFFDIVEDENHVLWLATNRGVIEFSKLTEKFKIHDKFKPDDLMDDFNTVYALQLDQNNKMWVGTQHGLYLLNRQTGGFNTYFKDRDGSNGVSHSYILDMEKDNSGNLWLATTKGLFKFDEAEKKFSHYVVKYDMVSDLIISIEKDQKGNLWMGTNRGLSMLNLETLKFTHYELDDGLQSNDFSQGASAVSESGELLFGGIDGFNVFNPEEIVKNIHQQ